WLLQPPARAGTRNRFQKNLPVRKSFSKLRMAQAWNYFERKHWLEAENAMDQALCLYPANPEAVLRAGDMYTRMRKFDRAEALLKNFAAHDPTNRQLQPFGDSIRKLRELDELRQTLEKDFEVKITGNLTLQLLQIYAQLDMKNQMFEKADLLLRLPNLHVDFYRHLATFMQREENPEYYEKALLKWAEKDPQAPEPHIDLAAIALSAGDYTRMAQELVTAIQLDPAQSRTRIAADPRFVDIHHWTQFQRLIQPSDRGFSSPHKNP
ncbi:MAG: tetratricopeptide repeat protein, partial [Kiritimatiellia bacterium]